MRKPLAQICVVRGSICVGLVDLCDKDAPAVLEDKVDVAKGVDTVSV